MKTELEKFVKWLEDYNEFCHNNMHVRNGAGELRPQSIKYRHESDLLERILCRMKSKKLAP